MHVNWSFLKLEQIFCHQFPHLYWLRKWIRQSDSVGDWSWFFYKAQQLQDIWMFPKICLVWTKCYLTLRYVLLWYAYICININSEVYFFTGFSNFWLFISRCRREFSRNCRIFTNVGSLYLDLTWCNY
jgi:hypothetical protein